MFGRGAGGVGRTFDARQKIGMTDVRQRLVKDAREKLGQKDARFRIRGGGAGGVQDARQMINSRKGGQNTFNVTPQSLQQIPAAQLQPHVACGTHKDPPAGRAHSGAQLPASSTPTGQSPHVSSPSCWSTGLHKVISIGMCW
uniref:DNA polymerase delta interacting protein 3 n=1 Tax=Hucho hucho TaxID=62062 RepID=A0A4W5P949_9TELE